MKAASTKTWTGMMDRIRSSVDPAVGYRDRLLHTALEAWAQADSTVQVDDGKQLAAALGEAGKDARERFFEAWCEGVYDTVAILKDTQMDKRKLAYRLKSVCSSIHSLFILRSLLI